MSHTNKGVATSPNNQQPISVLERVLGCFLKGKTQSLSLLYGPSGVGMTNLCLQFVVSQAMRNSSTLYVSLNEKPQELRNSAIQFGWDLETLEEEKILRMIDVYSARFRQTSNEGYAIRGQFDISAIVQSIHEAYQEMEVNNIVIDSFSSLALSFPLDQQLYEQLSRFIAFINSSYPTFSVITWSKDVNSIISLSPEPLLPLFQGIVYVDFDDNKSDLNTRRIQLIKTRGVQRDPTIHYFRFSEEGPILTD